MTILSFSPSLAALLLLGAAPLSGCSWVDSTGKQAGEEEIEEIEEGITIPVTQFESSTRALQPDEAIGLLEDAANRIQLSGADSSLRQWTWGLIGEGDTQLCEGISGFDQSVAAESLALACTDPSHCNIDFEEYSDNEDTEFAIEVPQLKAPVALTYLLSAETEEGNTVQRQQILCALSVNEAPLANDDFYKAIAGETRTLRGDDNNSLISNDYDDEDARNQPLSVVSSVVVAPRYAETFTLQSDGGFIYKAPADIISANGNGTLFDTFVYAVSDGLHEAEATATITIVDENTAPILIEALPYVEIDISDAAGDTPEYTIDLSMHFSDADDDPLRYSLASDSLPDAVVADINEEKILSFIVDASETESPTGDFSSNVTATDGIDTVTAELLLSVIDSAQQNNQPPTAEDISNLRVEDSFEYDVSVFFDDPDGDELTFSGENIPPDVELSSSGVITGTSTSENSGSWLINITAADPLGATVSDAFRLTIR